MIIPHSFLIGILMAILCNVAVGQSPASCSQNSDPAVYSVTKAYLETDTTQNNRDLQEWYIEDEVTIGLCGIDKLLEQIRTAGNPNTPMRENVHLFINGLDSGLQPVKLDIDSGSFTFALNYNKDNADIWKTILYDPIGERFADISLSVGLYGYPPLVRLPGSNTSIRFNKLWIDSTTWILLLGLVATGAAIIYLGLVTDMLRIGPRFANHLLPYSLGRIQMAWWFMLIISSFVLIWLVNGVENSISMSLLWLMGISGATGLAAEKVQSPQNRDNISLIKELNLQHQTLLGSLKVVEKEIRALNLQGPGARSGEGEPSQLGDQANQLESKKKKLMDSLDQLSAQLADDKKLVTSRGFARDLVSNDDGEVSLDRLQIVAWTLVLSVIFVYDVYYYLTMPEFDTNLLILMGISSGTYIGFKFPESAKVKP